jgi:NAD(P)-dependent dehydrogenase (short-subunit alcohol dehydrogenase family)
MGRLEGKVAIITGAGSGIGEASARAFASEGANVIIADMDVVNGRRVAQEIGGEAFFVDTDVSRDADVARLIQSVLRRQGRIDILLNNAGIVPLVDRVVDLPEDVFDRTIAVNVKGTWLGMKHAAPVMSRQGGGCIINTASIAGLMGNENQLAYGASKGAVIQMTRNCAAEFAAAGVRVNAICPGTVLTPLSFSRRPHMSEAEIEAAFIQRQPLKRVGRPIDVARTAVWLASDDACFVTAQTIVVDGGATSIRTLPPSAGTVAGPPQSGSAAAGDR